MCNPSCIVRSESHPPNTRANVFFGASMSERTRFSRAESSHSPLRASKSISVPHLSPVVVCSAVTRSILDAPDITQPPVASQTLISHTAGPNARESVKRSERRTLILFATDPPPTGAVTGLSRERGRLERSNTLIFGDLGFPYKLMRVINVLFFRKSESIFLWLYRLRTLRIRERIF